MNDIRYMCDKIALEMEVTPPKTVAYSFWHGSSYNFVKDHIQVDRLFGVTGNLYHELWHKKRWTENPNFFYKLASFASSTSFYKQNKISLVKIMMVPYLPLYLGLALMEETYIEWKVFKKTKNILRLLAHYLVFCIVILIFFQLAFGERVQP